MERSRRVLDLGAGLEVWHCHVDDLREQDVNAQVMPKAMFDRLKQTIASEQRLESLPFVALMSLGDKQWLEIVSGHHRVRTARAAGLEYVHAIVDVTGLDRDAVAAKQLAHNAIHGESDPQLVKKIYESIRDVNRRLESFIDPASLNIRVEKVEVGNIDLGVKYRTALVMFLPYDQKLFEEALDACAASLVGDIQQVYMAELSLLERFREMVKRAGKEYDIKATGTILSRIAEMVADTLGEPLPSGGDGGEEFRPVRDVVGASVVPADVAQRMRAALEREAERQGVPKRDRWRVLASLVLGEPLPGGPSPDSPDGGDAGEPVMVGVD